MKKSILIASIALTGGLLFSSPVAQTFASEGTSVSSQNISESKVYDLEVYLKLIEEVQQGLITTDEQAWDRLEELDAIELPPIITTFGSPYGFFATAAEIAGATFAVGPIDTATAKTDADKALSAAQNSGFSGAVDGKQDAFRHAYWNVLMTRDIGAGQAKKIADNHEQHNPSHPLANQMDLYNNSIGRSSYTGTVTTDSGLETVIKSKVTGGSLQYIGQMGLLLPTNH